MKMFHITDILLRQMGNISLWQEIRHLYHMFIWVTMAPLWK
ncbi:hypothetical protein SAMN05720781_1908 [Fibrobacter sp. UWT3]|nr:hypothetical protein SAMN05720781_1908 [Fibrobacter sp. UWT3]